MIYTQYELLVQQTLKGVVRSSVLVAVVGGASGNVQLRVPGAPDLGLGDQVVFFGVPLAGYAGLTPVGTFDGLVQVRTGRGDAVATVAPRGTPEELPAFLQEIKALTNRP